MTISTKDQEWKALEQINSLVKSLGETSYLGTAFKGVFEAAKREAAKVAELASKVKRLEAELEREQEWKPYEMEQNAKQSDYAKLAESAADGKCAYYMTDEEAKDWICSEFDFDRNKITILNEVDKYEINRHRQLRKTGRKIDRRPVYCATDCHNIRFNTSRDSYRIGEKMKLYPRSPVMNAKASFKTFFVLVLVQKSKRSK